jgi:L-asparaginase
MKKPRILIVYTGGTIGMIEDPKAKTLKPFDFSHLMENVPKVKMLDYDIDNIQFNPPIDSSDMDVSHWQDIARSIAEHYEKYDGFVVLHGTDTMAYTASALSFMLGNLAKPVIITGSQLPIGEVRTDGEENLITALQIAADRDADGNPTVREVAILFENFLWRGNRSTKRSADNFNAFKSNNYPELAKIGLGIHFNHNALSKTSLNKPLHPRYNLDTSVMSIDLFPGLNKHVLRHQLSTPGIKGVVLRTYGAGNGPTKSWFIDAVRDAISRGIIILNVTQCVNGAVHSNRYMGGDYLSTAGVVSGHDLTFEAAITKMMFLFGLGLGHDEVVRRLTEPIAGELTLNHAK